MSGPFALDGLGELRAAVEQRLTSLDRERVVDRIWAGDHHVWSNDPTEITQPNRIGWLTVPEQSLGVLEELEAFANECVAAGIRRVVLLGMGGSSLAPEMLFSTYGSGETDITLSMLDSTVPEDILTLESGLHLNETLFVVSSKSGSTIETLSQFEHFWALIPDGAHFVAVTDPGSGLANLGAERGFRRVFLANPDVGGRYSALTHFGLVPAALIGVDLRALLAPAVSMGKACREPAASNPGAVLGAAMGEATRAGRDKLTVIVRDEIAGFGDWVEQLIAESTGKQGTGIVPIVHEHAASPEIYGNDRLFVAIDESSQVKALRAAGHPVIELPYESMDDLGAELFRWEFATAVAGHVLGINPFDQPNVQQAKDAASRALKGETPPLGDVASAAELLQQVQAGDYIGLLAYLPRTGAVRRRLELARERLTAKYRVAVTTGFGPRYLHSTGQVHKGGPNSGVFFVLTHEPHADAPIPNAPFGFAALNRAQALGDLDALRSAGRRVTMASLEDLEAALS